MSNVHHAGVTLGRCITVSRFLTPPLHLPLTLTPFTLTPSPLHLQWKYRTVFAVTSLLFMVANLLNIVVYQRWNVAWGIPGAHTLAHSNLHTHTCTHARIPHTRIRQADMHPIPGTPLPLTPHPPRPYFCAGIGRLAANCGHVDMVGQGECVRDLVVCL